MHDEEEDDVSERPVFRHEKTPVLNVGHLITLGLAVIVNGVILAFSLGSYANQQKQNTDDIFLLKRQDITPGALQRISVIEAKMSAQTQADWEWKREIKEQLKDISIKLDRHADGKQ